MYFLFVILPELHGLLDCNFGLYFGLFKEMELLY
jgi:hypothetical protein